MSKFFPLLLPSETCVLPFDFTLERDPKNTFYYQRDIENYMDQVLNFLLFDRHEYIHTESSGQYTLLWVYVTFSLFFKI